MTNFTPYGYRLELDDLDDGRAIFRSDAHRAQFGMPRPDWEQAGRPGELWINTRSANDDVDAMIERMVIPEDGSCPDCGMPPNHHLTTCRTGHTQLDPEGLRITLAMVLAAAREGSIADIPTAGTAVWRDDGYLTFPLTSRDDFPVGDSYYGAEPTPMIRILLTSRGLIPGHSYDLATGKRID